MPQLSDLQATDALLDRLASRTVTDEDRADPVIDELARLAAYADESLKALPELDRLIEVLDGRPLYMFDRSAEPVAEADEPIQLGGRGVARLIDLSDSASAARTAAEQSESSRLPGVAARTASSPEDQDDETPAVASLALIRSMRAAAARRSAMERAPGWHGVIQQMALPAASIVAIALLGGGVTAVVAGDPMAPIDGVQRIASQLPGFRDSKSDTARKQETLAQSEIKNAAVAVNKDPAKAQQLLASASDRLPDVSADKQPQLQAQIDDVQSALSTATQTPVVTATPEITPSAEPSQTQTPEPSVTPTDEPSADPSVTTPESTPPLPDDVPATAGAGAAGVGDVAPPVPLSP